MSVRASVRDPDVCEDGGRLLGPPPTPRPLTGGSAFLLPVSGVLRSSPFCTRRLPAVPAALDDLPNATARTRAVQLGRPLATPVISVRNTYRDGTMTSALYSLRSCIASSPRKNRRVNSAHRRPGRISIFSRTGTSVGFQAR